MNLFSEFKIRNSVVKNRICVPPMVCYNFSDKNHVSDLNVAHYESLAKGNASVVIVEATCVKENGLLHSSQLGIWDDSFIEGYEKLASAINKYNCLSIIQIHHAGVVAKVDKPVGPVDYEKARMMSTLEVDEIIEDFVNGCFRAYLAGFKGVELHGCHSFLLSQFLNPKLNTREDIYKDGIKVVESIITKLRKKVSDDFIIGIRLGGFEPNLDMGIKNAIALDNLGIDFINVSYGFKNRYDEKFDTMLKDVHYAAKIIKEKVSCPVFVVNSIVTKSDASDILDKTLCDMVCIGRCSLVNPNWTNDAFSNLETGKCYYCDACFWRTDYKKCPGRIMYNKKLLKNK